jgi:hypothetical protein
MVVGPSMCFAKGLKDSRRGDPASLASAPLGLTSVPIAGTSVSNPITLFVAVLKGNGFSIHMKQYLAVDEPSKITYGNSIFHRPSALTCYECWIGTT